MLKTQITVREKYQIKTTRYEFLRVVGIIVLLGSIVFFSYFSAFSNKPVAEDFLQPQAFMELGDNKQFRPFFGLLMFIFQTFFGTPTASPENYHLFSVGIHLVATLTVFFFSQQIGFTQVYSTLIALVFAIYPRQHEPIFWPASSLHALMTTLLLFSLIFYIQGRQNNNRLMFLASTTFFILSMLSSEAAAVGVIFILVFEIMWYWNTLGANLPNKILMLSRRLLPFITIVGIYGVILIFGSSSLTRFVGSRNDTSFYHLSLSFDQLNDFGGYLSYLFFPFAPLRELSLLPKLGMLTITLMAIVVGLVLGTRLVRFGILWMIIGVIPYVLLVPFGNADRYFYLSSIGFCITIFGGFDMFFRFLSKGLGRKTESLTIGVGLLILTVFTVAAYNTIQERSQEWHTAGQIANDLLKTVYQDHPVITEGSVFYFLNLPNKYKQAYVMGVGVGSALRLHYNNTNLKVAKTTDPIIVAELQKTTPSKFFNNKNIYIYLFTDNRLIDYSSSIENPTIRSLLETLPNSV